ncbi:MAG TPA: CHAT domain-containing protein, partial [Blastocatellia bacterium]
AMTLGNIGLAQDSAGLYAAAIDSLDRSLAIERRLVDREGKARALGNLGRVCYDRDETAPALDFLQQSLQLWQLAGKPDAIASAFAAIGNVYYAEKDYSHALDSYQKSLALYESSNSKEGMGFLLAAIASVQYSSGDYNAALETAGKGAAIAREIENREILWYSLLKQGQAELKQQKIDAARQAYSEATSVLDDLRGLPSAPGRVPAFAQGRKTVLGAMADLLMQVDQPEQAFSYAEREKQQVLIDLVRKVRVTRGMTAQESSEERGLIDKLVSADAQNYSERLRGEAAAPTSQLATNARTALQTYRAFEERLYQSRPDVKHRRAMDTTDASGANEILHLPPGTVAFEYVASDDARPYLFTISQSPNDAANEKGIWVSSGNSQPRLAIKAYALNIDPAVLKDKVRQFRQAISSSDGQYETLGRDLYDTLIAPAATDLVGKSHLVVVPDGELWSLPFQALERDGGHFLIEDLPVTYAPSLAALGYALSSEIGGTNRARDQHGASRPTLLEVGAPAIDSSTLGWTQAAYGFDLDAEPSGESAELAAVGAQYGPSRTAALTSNHARKDLLYQEAPKHEYLYISAPGIIDDLNPAYSVILLAGEGPDSKNAGLLTAGEMINADLRSRLVVLSRTEEPAELMRSGEGLIFLEWALLGSGVPAALITQWRTPPGNLTQLMSDLNTEAAAAKIAYHADLSAALRDAVLKMIARPSNRHPFYWAGISALGAAVPAR